MDCDYFKELLSVYIDNYIMPDEKLELEKHLLECSGCKEYLLKLRNYKNDLKNFEELEAPLGFEKKIMKKIEEKEKPSAFSFGQRFILGFSAILIVFVSLFVIYINMTKNNDVILEEKMKIQKEKIELEEKKEVSESQKQFERTIPKEQKKEIPKRKDVEEKKMAVISYEEAKQEASKITKIPKPSLAEEKKELEVVPDLAPSALPIPKYWIKINIKEENFKDAINKIEEILKNEKIDFKRIKVSENKEEIIIISKDFKDIIEKINSVEGVKIENYKLEQIKDNINFKIEILKE